MVNHKSRKSYAKIVRSPPILKKSVFQRLIYPSNLQKGSVHAHTGLHTDSKLFMRPKSVPRWIPKLQKEVHPNPASLAHSTPKPKPNATLVLNLKSDTLLHTQSMPKIPSTLLARHLPSNA